MKYTAFVLASMTLMSWCSLASAGDAAAGKAVFDEKCAECHYADDFTGESESDIAGFMAEARSGAIDHESETVKEISDADAANIVAFWASQE